MEQSYSYNPVLSTAHHPLNQAQAHHHQQHSPTQHTQGGMASPRSIQPLPPLISAPQPYGIQSPPQQAHPHSQSQYPRNPSYGNGYEYRPAAETHYTHQPAANLLSMSSPTGVAPQGYASPSQSTGMSMAAHGGAQRQMDTTGQLPPLGMRSRLTTSVFEEEGSLCFQVDVDGICVARREGPYLPSSHRTLVIV
ncbi:hypothetical protein BJ878DRAFT_238873 [Calycina marina]|uniref:Uncharacterized protein n=1 Tax=Calycina marina TaxID=1763456 RepID=A0A9P8CH74_9HELO|nr:hypothetical protein BJ878DRAFT_238873 [Calycina marina]